MYIGHTQLLVMTMCLQGSLRHASTSDATRQCSNKLGIALAAPSVDIRV